MKIGIVGAGGVGGLMAALLVEAGEDVALIARGERLQAIRDEGLLLDSGMGAMQVRPRIVTADAAEAGVMDLVIMATKTWQLEEAARGVRAMVGPRTAVMPVQNGVEGPEVLSRVFGKEHALVGIISVSSFKDGVNGIRHRGDSIWVQVGEQDSSKTARVEQIAATFRAARMDVEVPEDAQAALWYKLIGIAASSAVGALTRVPVGAWRQSPGMVDLYRGVLEENSAVAAAHGVRVPEDYVENVVVGLPTGDQGFTTSMQRDIMEGKPSELEAQIGVFVRKGQEIGVPTPLNALVYAALLPQELQARGENA